MPGKTLTATPQNGGWNRTATPRNRWHSDGVNTENEDAPNVPTRYTEREDITDEARARASKHAQRVNSKTKTLTLDELNAETRLDVRRAAAHLQALDFLARKRISASKG